MGIGENYQQQLRGLLPKGWAWPDEESTNIAKLLRAYAEELANVDSEVSDLLIEAYPLTTFDLLSDWERFLGLPDSCQVSGTLQERRQAVYEKLSRLGGQSPAFFIQVAAALGFTITIEEYRYFLSGRGRSGDRIAGEDWVLTWKVLGEATTYTIFKSGQSSSGDRLRFWGNALLECMLQKLKPAHTYLIFAYGV